MGFIADVFDVTLIDGKGNVFASTTLQDANIEFTLEESEIRGGRGNNLLGVLHSNRDIVLNLTDVSFRYDWIAMQLGTDIKTGAGIAYARPEFYTVESGQITLKHEPIANDHGLAIYDASGKKLDATLDGSVVTLTGVEDGDEVEVRTYKYQTDAATEIIEFDVNKFPKGVKAILETIEIDGDETITHIIQYQFDNAVPQGNFTITTAAAREATTQETSFRIIKPKTTTQVGRALRIPFTEGAQ